MKKLVFIVNRQAGNGRALEVIRGARRPLWGWPLEIRYSRNPVETRRICEALRPEETEGVFLIGGDGTVMQALPSLAGRDLPLGILPGGTANDLAEELGMAVGWDAVQRMVDLRLTQRIDLVTVNGSYFTTVGGMGIGSVITHEYNERRARSPWVRPLARLMRSELYSVLSAKCILFGEDSSHLLRITADDYEGTLRSAALFVCNQGSLGGDMLVAPDACNNDGFFDVLVCPGHSRNELIDTLFRLKMSRDPRDAVRFRTRRLLLEDIDGRPVRIFGDGEIVAEASRVEFRIAPGALTVYRPEERRTAEPARAEAGLRFEPPRERRREEAR